MGDFVCFEGVDGVGKTTLRRHLAAWLRDRRRPVMEIGQHSWLIPSISAKLVDLRGGANQDLSAQQIGELYRLDKAMHARANVLPNLERRVVIADRYIFSDAAYLEALHGIPAVETLEWHHANGTAMPRVIFLVSARPATYMRRILSRGKSATHYERPAPLKAVNEVYRTILLDAPLPWLPRVVPVDNERQTPEEAFLRDILPRFVDGVE